MTRKFKVTGWMTTRRIVKECVKAHIVITGSFAFGVMVQKNYHVQNVNRRIMRRGSKPDLNHAEIRDGLRSIIGKQCVVDIKDFGGGIGDLLVGFRGINYLLEVKKDKKATLTPAELAFKKTWEGQWNRVESLEQAMKVIGLQ